MQTILSRTERETRQSRREMDRRFEVFVSSTVLDLEAERQYLRSAIVAAGHIPTGMERFSEGHEPQWEAISRAIDQSDCYVLVLGARYGSCEPTGIGYTHHEYTYALSLGKPVLVFCMSHTAAKTWPLRDDEQSVDTVERERCVKLVSFRTDVLTRLVNLWSTREEFENLVDRNLGTWIDRVCNKGWVRWDRYSLTASQRDVYTYLFNNFTPFRRVAFAEPFLEHLDEPLESIEAVLLMLTVLMKDFIAPRLAPHIRVYFAYRLAHALPMSAAPNGGRECDTPAKAYYAFGTTVQRRDLQHEHGLLVEDPWSPGFLVGKDSNLDRAYSSAQIRCVADATKASRDREIANQLVRGEGSVLSVPIVFARGAGEELHSIGVLGLSSPEREELSSDEFRRLALELQTVLSSLFYAHALSIQSHEAEPLTPKAMAMRLRRDIARHFEDTLP
ncbi:MAG: DUF4062 domain-containing protein [Gemmatimonadaceae bacterium]